VTELADDLRRHLADIPVVASPPSTWYRTQKFVRRHRSGVVVGSVLVMLVLASVVAFAEQARRTALERDRANQEAALARAVTDFLQNDLLAQVRPSVQTEAGARVDSNLTVRT